MNTFAISPLRQRIAVVTPMAMDSPALEVVDNAPTFRRFLRRRTKCNDKIKNTGLLDHREHYCVATEF